MSAVSPVMAMAHMRGLTFPEYTCRPEHCVFPTREAFLGYAEAAQLCARVDEALLISDNADDNIAFSALYRYDFGCFLSLLLTFDAVVVLQRR